MDIQGSWTKEETLTLIAEFKKHPILYKAQHPHHLKVNKKKEAIASIAKEVQAIKPSVDEKAVRMKLKTLTQQLHRERKKITCSKKSGGAGTSAVYKPTLWCFEELSFLINANDKKEGVSNISEMLNSSVGEKDCEHLESPPVNRKPKKSKKEVIIDRFAETAERSLRIMEEVIKAQHSKEDILCQYVCSELKGLKLEESFDEVHLGVVMLLQSVKAKERKMYQQQMWRCSSPASPSPSTPVSIFFGSSSSSQSNADATFIAPSPIPSSLPVILSNGTIVPENDVESSSIPRKDVLADAFSGIWD